MQTNKKIIHALIFGFLSLVCSLTLAWSILFHSNFLFGLWHDHAGIAQAIDRYAPQNRFKPGFADTTREQRIDLFSQINKQVHGDGRDLGAISYLTPTSQGSQFLLRSPEVIHLVDVAKLIDGAASTAYCLILLWLFLLARYAYQKKPLPSFALQCVTVFCFVLLGVLLVLLIGPERVFNQLHIWLFPKENPWFFYYQDSLMSTLMYAPHLFGWIAISLLVLSLSLFMLLNSILWCVAQRFIKKR